MTTRILVLCTHNSARSILAEAMLNHLARLLGTDVRAFSAGSAPSGVVHPIALEVLSDAGIETEDLRSKSWDEFAGGDATPVRVVITVCDRAAAEPCPWWPGSPVQVHWGYPDPSNAGADGDSRRAAFELTRQALGYRLLQLLRLPLARMGDEELKAALTTIARS